MTYTLGAQYTLELKFLNYVDGTPIDHDRVQAILETAINDAVEAITADTGHQVALGEVTYETDYPIEEDE